MKTIRTTATVTEDGVLTLQVPVEVDRGELTSLVRQVAVAGKQVHDASIVAAMQVHGIRRLLTHNEAHFARFSHLITIVPLRSFR